MGLCLIETRDRIELPESGSNEEWSVIIYGLDEDATASAIKEWSETTVRRFFLRCKAAYANHLSN